jgi:hypothetical protein
MNAEKLSDAALSKLDSVAGGPSLADVATDRPADGIEGQQVRQEAGAPARRRKQAKSTSADTAGDILPDSPATDAPPAKKAGKKAERKAKPTGDTAMAQTTLVKGKVTKPASTRKQSRKKTETISRHFTAQPPAQESVSEHVSLPVAEELDVVPEPAMKRRLDWTPPREGSLLQHIADSSAVKEVSPPGNPGAESMTPAQKDVFKSLLDTYGRKPEVNAGPDVADTSGSSSCDILGKRKLIEMVATVGSKAKTPEPSPVKPKAAKKKPRTITELATAGYRLPDEDDVILVTDNPKQNSLLGFLETTGEQIAGTTKDTGVKAKGAKKPAKAKPSKKAEVRKPVLLSPTSAMRQVAKQDFVFGTASQLATEDDPDLLRALHEAMKESNQADSDPFTSPAPAHSSLAFRRRLGTGLWSAGARGDDGDLLSLEVLDLTHSPQLLRDSMLPGNSRAEVQAAKQPARNDKSFIEIEVLSDDSELLAMAAANPMPPSSRHRASQVLQLEGLAPSSPNQHQVQEQTTCDSFEPPPSNQEHHQLLLSQSSSPLQPGPEAPPPPKFELYSDAMLAKEVASYGFKAIKKRSAMIALLQQCWESKGSKNFAKKTNHVSMSTSSAKQAASPPRPRGRPRKAPATSAPDPAVKAPLQTVKRGRMRSVAPVSTDTEASQDEKPAEKRSPRKPKKAAAAALPKPKGKAASKRARSPQAPPATAPATPRRRNAAAKSAIEIADSESDDPFVSSPESLSGKTDASSSPRSQQRDVSITKDTEMSLVASPTSQQLALFGYITQAVITAPPTKDPTNPSWHEKMLMYDPIILEDLAAWLNSGQLDRVGYDGEVSPGDVKRWCESKSVCCLWRVNLNGKERKRF